MSTVSAGNVAKGVAWMAAARVMVRAIGFVSTLVLARLLAPVDFGLVAMAMFVAGALELLTLYSFDVALIQIREITKNHYDSAWTLNLLMGLALASVLVLSAPWAAGFYHEPRLHWILPLIALKYVIDNATNTGTVDFRRELQFGKEFVLQVVPKLASIFVTLPLAYWLRDYRALITGMLASAAVGCIVSFVIHPHRPRWCTTEAGGLFRFSRWLLVNNFVNFVRTRSADLLVGRMLGATPLGVFTLALELSNLPSTELVAPINRVLFPTYVKIAAEPERLRRAFSLSLGMIAMLILPVSLGMAALSEPLVRVMLGEKWGDVVGPLSLLALAGATTVLHTNLGSLYNALGMPRVIAVTQVIYIVTLVPMQIAAVHYGGLMAISAVMLIHGACIGLPITYAIVFRTTPIRVVDVVAPLWRPLLAGAGMFAVLHALLAAYYQASGVGLALAVLLSGCVVGAVCYLALIYGLWWSCGRPNSAEATVIQFVRKRLARRAG